MILMKAITMHDNQGVYELFNLIKQIPGSNVYCLNSNGVILWHNNSAVTDLRQNQQDLKGKTAFDFFSKETAEFCLECNREAIDSGNTIAKRSSFQLITGEIQEYFITRTPWSIVPGKVEGVIINSINIKDVVCQKIKDCYFNNQLDEMIFCQLQNFYFNSKQRLKEISLLTNLIISNQNNNEVNSLCLELENFAKTLLSYCDDILISKEKMIDAE